MQKNKIELELAHTSGSGVDRSLCQQDTEKSREFVCDKAQIAQLKLQNTIPRRQYGLLLLLRSTCCAAISTGRRCTCVTMDKERKRENDAFPNLWQRPVDQQVRSVSLCLLAASGSTVSQRVSVCLYSI